MLDRRRLFAPGGWPRGDAFKSAKASVLMPADTKLQDFSMQNQAKPRNSTAISLHANQAFAQPSQIHRSCDHLRQNANTPLPAQLSKRGCLLITYRPAY